MRIAHNKDLVGINVPKQPELQDEIVYQRIDVVVVETVPGVIWRAQGQVKVPTRFRMILVITLHLLPLAVVDRLRSTAASVHRNE